MKGPLPDIAAALLLAAAAAAQTAGVVETIDGRRWSGAVTIDEAGEVTVAAAEGTQRFDLAELQTFVPAAAGSSPVAGEHRVWLRSGAELPCVSLAVAPRAPDRPPSVVATLPCGAELMLPMGMVRAIRHAGGERAEPALFAADLKEPSANQDLLFVVKDGKAQRSSVRITDLADGKVAFELRGSGYEFPFAGVAAIVFGRNTGFAPDRQPKPRTAVELVTGERIEGRLLELATRVRLRLDEGAVLDVPTTALARLAVASDRLVRLGELVPTAAQTPAFDRVWPWSIDRTVAGPGFELDGRKFARGVAMVPRTRLTYDLGGNYDVFEATIGIDDRGGPLGNAVFRVLVDDRVAFEAVVTQATRPQSLTIELAKCQRLALEVDFGEHYDLGDHCVFADARVVQR